MKQKKNPKWPTQKIEFFKIADSQTFLPVFELMLDSLSTIKVEPHQCPSHQLILLTQGPINEIFTKKY